MCASQAWPLSRRALKNISIPELGRAMAETLGPGKSL
jgi:hypothetical protein